MKASKLFPVIGLFLVLGAPQAGHAQIFRFIPAGSQLDSDPINDIVIGPNQPLDFTIIFNQEQFRKDIQPFGQPANIDLISFEQFGNPPMPPARDGVNWDPAEWVPTELVNGACAGNTGLPLNGGVLEFNNCGVMPLPGGAPLPDIVLGTIKGVTVNPELWPGNGEFDFRMHLRSASYSGVFGGVAGLVPYNLTQEVSLQTVPGPLPIFGLLAGFGFSKKLRNRISASSGKN
jgi:hypothetical protein